VSGVGGGQKAEGRKQKAESRRLILDTPESENSNYCKVWRITNLRSKINPQAGQEMVLERHSRARDVYERTVC